MINWFRRRRARVAEKASPCCPVCGAEIERSGLIGYETCSLAGTKHYFRWLTREL